MPQYQAPEVKPRSERLAISTATESRAQRTLEASEKGASAVRHGGTQTAEAVAIERRELRVEVVNLEPRRQRRVPSMEVQRAEHGFVSNEHRGAERIEEPSDLNMTGGRLKMDANTTRPAAASAALCPIDHDRPR
jgi:hypothetical protein